MAEPTPLFTAAALRILNGMPADPNPQYFYEHLSGGFVWSDEFPELLTPEWDTVSHDYVYRFLVHIRRCITLGDMELESCSLWQQVLNHAPNWPGLLPARRTGRIVRCLRAAERLADRCYARLEAEGMDTDGG